MTVIMMWRMRTHVFMHLLLLAHFRVERLRRILCAFNCTHTHNCCETIMREHARAKDRRNHQHNSSSTPGVIFVSDTRRRGRRMSHSHNGRRRNGRALCVVLCVRQKSAGGRRQYVNGGRIDGRVANWQCDKKKGTKPDYTHYALYIVVQA